MLRKFLAVVGGLVMFVLTGLIGGLILLKAVGHEPLSQYAQLLGCIIFFFLGSTTGLCVGWISGSKSWQPALILFGIFVLWVVGLCIFFVWLGVFEPQIWIEGIPAYAAFAVVFFAATRIGEVLAGRRMHQEKSLVVKIVALSLCAFVVLNFGSWGLSRLLAPQSNLAKLEQMLAELKASGAPMSLSEAAPPPVRDEENGAILYVQAFDELAKWEEHKEFYYPYSREDTSEIREPSVDELISFFDISQAAYDLLKAGSERPTCRFADNYDEGLAVKGPPLMKLRQSAYYLKVRAATMMRQGRTGEAVETIRVLFRLSRSLVDEPTPTSFVTGTALYGFGFDALQETLQKGPIDEVQMRQLTQEIPWRESGEILVNALTGERGMGIRLFEELRTGKKKISDLPGTEGLGERLDAFFQTSAGIKILARDEVFYLGQMNELIRIAVQPYWQAQKQINDWKAKTLSPPKLALVSMVLVAGSGGVTGSAYRQAQEDVSLTALALMLYKVEKGHYPEGLSQLMPDYAGSLPIDPFTGNQLIYQRQENGFLLYSVGRNGQYDGGGGDDITWTMTE